jgi:hypothetical protein
MKNKFKFSFVLFVSLCLLMLSCGQSSDKTINRENVISEFTRIGEIREKIDIKIKNTCDSIEYRIGGYNNLAVDYKDNIKNIKERTDEVVTFIQGLKIEIVMTAEGQGSSAVIGNEIDAGKITRLNNTKVPAEILLGENNDGKAIDLKAIIQEYKKFLLQVTDNDALIAMSIDTLLNADESKKSEPGNSNEETVPWQQIIFRDQPVGSVLVILSGLQNNAKNAESEVLSFILNKIDSQLLSSVKKK